MPIESLRLRFALLQSLNTTLETFFLPLVELRQTPMYTRSIAALLKEAKGSARAPRGRTHRQSHQAIAWPPGGCPGRHPRTHTPSRTFNTQVSFGAAVPPENSYFNDALKKLNLLKSFQIIMLKLWLTVCSPHCYNLEMTVINK